jgi:MFS family permease
VHKKGVACFSYRNPDRKDIFIVRNLQKENRMSQQTVSTSNEAVKTPGYAWIVLFAIYLATLAAPLNQTKVPPVLPLLRETFALDYSSAGQLISIFSIMGFVLALPAGFILQKIGIKATGLISVGSLMIGSALGAMAGGAGLLFFGRFIEGIGMGLIMVAAPAAISIWFPAEKRGLPMGLWASSVGVGIITAMNLAPKLVAAYSWQAVWWAGSAFAAIAFVLFGILFRMPKKDEIQHSPAQPAPGSPEDKSISLTKAMASSSLWMIGIAFGMYNLTVMAWNSFYPDFLATKRGYSLDDAGFISSLLMMVGIFASPIGGFISDRIGSRKKVIVIPYIILTLLFLFPFTVTGWMIPGVMISAGIMVGAIAPVILAAVPEIMKKPETIGIGMGVAALCQNLGMYIGPAVFGALLEITSWASAGYLMIPLCAIGVIATWTAKIR